MRVDDLILELQDMVNDAKPVPLSRDKRIIYGDRMLDLIDELNDAMPADIRKANGITADRDQILAEAKRAGEDIIRQAEERRKVMVSESEIVRAAKAEARDIIEDAKRKSADMQHAAGKYVEDLMRRTDEAITASAQEIRKARQSFKNSSQSQK